MAWLEVEELNSTADALNRLKDYVSNPEVWGDWLSILLRIAAVIIIGKVIKAFSGKSLDHMMVSRNRSPLKFDQRRTKTIGKLLNNLITYTVNFIILLVILSQFGIDLRPVLAGAGVVGLAIGFGAQSLVKDVITGFFIIFEDQFAVGDVIQTASFKGTVEEIGLRVTRLRSPTGEVHVIPNGTIQQVTNYSVNNSLAIVDVPVANVENVERVIEVLRQAVKESYGSLTGAVKEPEVLGIQSLAAAELAIRVTAECGPNAQACVERELKRIVKAALEREQQSVSEG